MSLNPNTRTECVETLLNPRELSTLDVVRGGMARSVFFRYLLDKAAGTHGKPPAPVKESRLCRVGRPASRGAGFQMQRRQV